MRGKRWVLRPHVVEVVGKTAKANLFEVPGGYALPVTFGGQASTATVLLTGLPRLAGQASFRVEMIHPGENAWNSLQPGTTAGSCASMCRSAAAVRW